MNNSVDVIFIHSLWRSGSTYLFKTFRRSDRDYYCYQEPIHELALKSISNSNRLLTVTPQVTASLNHPKLEKPYFQELYNVWDNCKKYIEKDILYNEYFNSKCSMALKKYLSALIEYAEGIPVIQECRTSSRIGAIKEEFGGVHIYLWRNPWDQWLSFKITPFFDLALLQILNTTSPPKVISKLNERINFKNYYHESIEIENIYFKKNKLSLKDNYLVFYILWCLGLLEGLLSSDILINIDKLSDSIDEYKSQVLNELSTLGIDSIDFKDADVNQYYFSEEDRSFFIAIELEAHNILKNCNIDITDVLLYKKKFQPKRQTKKVKRVSIDEYFLLKNKVTKQFIKYNQDINNLQVNIYNSERKNKELRKNIENYEEVVSRIKEEYKLNSINELLTKSGYSFILSSYLTLLNRLPDKKGAEHYIQALENSKLSKKDIINKICNSLEGKRVVLPKYQLQLKEMNDKE